MTIEYRIPRRPAWLYPAGTIIRTRYGRFRVQYERFPVLVPLVTPSPRRELVRA